MKERTYPAQQVEKEELLRNFFHKLKIPIVKRLYLSEFLGNPLEFFNMIDYDDYETKNMKPNSIIELAKLIGIIHSKSPVENRETDNIEGIYRFITQTDTFTSNELALIQLHKKNIDQKKSELKVCLIHNDLHDGNILIKNNKITGIVDFEKCKNYYCAWDVARALSSIGYHYKKALILYHNLEIFLREYKKWVNKKELSVLHSMTIFSTIEHLLNTLIFEERSGICKKNESKMILEKTKLFLNDDEFKNIFTKICY